MSYIVILHIRHLTKREWNCLKKIFVFIMCFLYIIGVAHAKSNNSLTTYDLGHFSISIFSHWKHEKINDTTHLLYTGEKNEPNYWQMSVRFIPFDLELNTDKELKDLYATMLLSENHQQIYDYKYLKENNFSYLIERYKEFLKRFDIVRIDHFIGYDIYYKIPINKSVNDGIYEKGPGFLFFDECIITMFYKFFLKMHHSYENY